MRVIQIRVTKACPATFVWVVTGAFSKVPDWFDRKAKTKGDCTGLSSIKLREAIV